MEIRQKGPIKLHYASKSDILRIIGQGAQYFAENKINLTKIQSVPIIGKPNEYTFHVDIEWDELKNYEHAIHVILKNVSSLAILGEYVSWRFVNTQSVKYRL